MDVDASRHGAVTVVRPRGARLDALAALGFKDRMQPVIEEAGARVVLDLSEVTFLDSSGLGAVVAAQRFLRAGQVLELAALTPAVARVFRLTRMDTVFAIHPGVDDALRVVL
ncbi:STAS domain-containing protein [Tabrizicola sp. M-4]|uniref:STAS domain-containing protein n=1 Tax=Tabrizicola sp. M-4 TaxID=3055847 RepID=UPI003DA8658F